MEYGGLNMAHVTENDLKGYFCLLFTYIYIFSVQTSAAVSSLLQPADT